MEKKTLTARFGQRVRELRRRKNLSLEALAARAKLNSNFLQKLETGKQSPTLDSIEKVSRGLGVPVAQLFAFDEAAQETRKRLKQQIDKASEQEVVKIARILDAALY
jgi:transcriptional regulator with XRE-family HTH domain